MTVLANVSDETRSLIERTLVYKASTKAWTTVLTIICICCLIITVATYVILTTMAYDIKHNQNLLNKNQRYIERNQLSIDRNQQLIEKLYSRITPPRK